MKTAVTMSVKEKKIVKEFEDYLIKMGYRVTTPSGKPSTVRQYLKGVERVINEEGITLFQLKEKISEIVLLYDYGAKSELRHKNNDKIISALKAFQKFFNEKYLK